MLSASFFSVAIVRRFFARNRVFRISLLLTVALALTGLILVKARSNSRSAKSNQTSGPTIPVTQRLYVRPGALWPQLRWNLRALGDRLERPGREQVIVSGTLTRAGISNPVPAVLNLEAPNRMTLTMQSGLQTQAIQFDGTDSSWATLAASDRDLVETFLFDSPENFFFGQMNGAATRSLGSRFRLNQQDNSPPFYDIYAVVPRRNLLSALQGAKLFHFNSDTRLLELVRYEVQRSSISIRVEVRLSDWRELSGQKVAYRIERLEDGVSVMTLVIESVVFAPGTPGITI